MESKEARNARIIAMWERDKSRSKTEIAAELGLTLGVVAPVIRDAMTKALAQSRGLTFYSFWGHRAQHAIAALDPHPSTAEELRAMILAGPINWTCGRDTLKAIYCKLGLTETGQEPKPPAPETHDYLFDVRLIASLRVTAASEAEARAALAEAMDCAEVAAGCWADGSPIVFEASLDHEGDYPPVELVEVDGEDASAPRPPAPSWGSPVTPESMKRSMDRFAEAVDRALVLFGERQSLERLAEGEPRNPEKMDKITLSSFTITPGEADPEPIQPTLGLPNPPDYGTHAIPSRESQRRRPVAFKYMGDKPDVR